MTRVARRELTALPAPEEGEIMKDIILDSILFFLFLYLILINSIHISSLEERIEKLEYYHNNTCSECGQVLHN